MTTLHVFILLLLDHVDWRQHPSAVRGIWGEAENLDKLWVCALADVHANVMSHATS
jgi:hypothetical protein